ncbi:MAG: hypothetical protein LBV06_09875 [Propionibacteriaceae bacterium]|nr:hypothetical protein [Propionibacteriaceae bacterium]
MKAVRRTSERLIMLKFLKGFLLVLGAVLIVATIVLMVWDVIQINQVVAVANANKSNAAGFNANPRNWVLLGAGAALVGGLLLGLGLGMPNRTFKQRLTENNNHPAPPTTGHDNPPQSPAF